jgi:hypothetical protein
LTIDDPDQPAASRHFGREEPGPRPGSALPGGMTRRQRLTLIGIGLASWAAGGAATFISQNGAGAASLVAVGAVCGMFSFVGRWPSQISMSGNEISWLGVKDVIDSQIVAARASGEADSVLTELTSLRQRLDLLQRTGSAPAHPAQIYDEAALAAIRRVLPAAEVIERGDRSRATADFLLWYHGAELEIETKWRPDPERPFAGSTLPALISHLPPRAVLLVMANLSNPPRASAVRTLEQAMGERARIVAWRSIEDDQELGAALHALLEVARQT